MKSDMELLPPSDDLNEKMELLRAALKSVEWHPGFLDLQLSFNALKEIKWLRENRHTKIYRDFLEQLKSLQKSTITAEDSEADYKMRFSYAVTLMESCLCEMLKSVTMQYNALKENAMNNISELKNSKISAHLLLKKDSKEILDSIIMGHVSHILYHNMDKVTKVYSEILGLPFPLIGNDVNERLKKLMVLRHDIVHRNGVTIDGDKIDVSADIVISCIEDIRVFVVGVHQYIIQSLEKIQEKSV